MVVADGCTTWVVGTEGIGADPVGSDDGATDTLGPIADEMGSLGIIDVACTLGPIVDEIGSLGTIVEIAALGTIDVAGSLGPVLGITDVACINGLVLGITDVACTLWPTSDRIASLGTIDTD